MVHATVDILSLDRIQYESGNEAMITDQHFSDLTVQGQSDKDPLYKYMEKKTSMFCTFTKTNTMNAVYINVYCKSLYFRVFFTSRFCD